MMKSSKGVVEFRNLSSLESSMKHSDSNKYNSDYYVEGYATGYEPYVLYERDGIVIHERIDRNALDGVDLSDVILQYNHEGRVLARGSNNTLDVVANSRGLLVTADLSSNNDSRSLHEDIANGLINKMSWAFSVAEEEYDRETRTRHILRIGKVYDVSAVSIPANDKTHITARSYFDDVVKLEELQDDSEVRRKRLKLKYKLLKGDMSS